MLIKSVQYSEISDYAAEYGNIFQTEYWGRFKDSSDWYYKCASICENDEVIGFFVGLIRRLPFGKMLYITRGPIIFDWHKLDFKGFNEAMKKYCKQIGVAEVKFDPYILHSYHNLSDDTKEEKLNEDIVENLVKQGIRHKGYTKELNENIQPRINAVVYKDEYAKGNKKLAQYKRIAERRGVKIDIYEGEKAKEAVEDFFRVLHKTELRKDIRLRNEDYFRKMTETIENIVIYIGRIDLKQLKQDLDQEISDYEKEYAEFLNKDPNNPKKKNRFEERQVSIAKEKEAIEKGIENYGENVVPVSCALEIYYRDEAELIYAGFNEEFKYYSPAYLTWAIAIEHGFELGVDKVNLGGISSHEDDKLLSFKKIFNPTIERYIGEFDLISNPFEYNLFNMGIRVYKKVRRFI